MDIFYLGHSSFKLKGKNATVVTDPFDSDMVGLKFPKTEADIVSISHNHDDHNKAELIQGSPRVIKGPGEYEIKDVSILGFQTYHDNKKGEERGKNTVYVFEIDGVRICHLGDLGHKMSETLIENIGEIDVLLLPVGGFYTLGPLEASELVRDIEPSYVIPMHYYTQGVNKSDFSKLEPVDTFLKEIGLSVEKMSKLTVKKEEIDLEVQKVILLERK